jgi:hypothetical protein
MVFVLIGYGMQTAVITQATIHAKQAEVFKYLSDLKYHQLWNPQLLSISSSGKQLELGSEYKTQSQVLGVKIRARNVVTKFENLKELEISNNTGLVQYRANFKLRAKKNGTVLVCTTTVSTDSEAFAFAKPVLKLLARRELQSDMQALKLAVEHNLK